MFPENNVDPQNTEDANAKTTETYTWNKERTGYLLTRIIEYIEEHGKWPTKPTFDQWVPAFVNLYGKGITGTKLYEKKKRLRREWNAYNAMLNHTGFGYDPVTGSFTCDDALWEGFVKVNNVLQY